MKYFKRKKTCLYITICVSYYSLADIDTATDLKPAG